MSSSSTLVNVAEDAEQRLVRLLAETAQTTTFVQDCESCISQADACQLLHTILNDGGALGALFVLVEPPEEAISAFSLLTALLIRVGKDRPTEEAGLTQGLADAVTNIALPNNNNKDPSDIVQRKVSLLSVLYNMRSNGTEKCALLARMVALATPDLLQSGTPLGDMLLEDLADCPRIVALLDTWQVPVAERRELYLEAARGMAAPRKQRFLLLFVDSYKAGSPVSIFKMTKIM